MPKSYYMHTLNGAPASFDGDQISFASFYGKPNPLCESLQQIRREQMLSKTFRARSGFHDRTGDWRYGHIRVCLPQQEEG